MKAFPERESAFLWALDLWGAAEGVCQVDGFWGIDCYREQAHSYRGLGEYIPTPQEHGRPKGRHAPKKNQQPLKPPPTCPI
ncbi:hypothetical protein SAMN05216222_3965 [Pseudomonas prosekii]|uniref:Uncharacterized protein n=1 Tax=Pseudomonas prosekii TaxID=1148509 RepID=A0A1H1ZLN2_9PSED|nr:hypothetical protein SAMN05216222_3965 [Pseudomonas prosekii]